MPWRIRRYVPQGPSPFMMGQTAIWFDEHDTAYTDDPVVVEVAACAPELYEIIDVEEEARTLAAAVVMAAVAEPEPLPDDVPEPRSPREPEPEPAPERPSRREAEEEPEDEPPSTGGRRRR